MKWLRWLNTRIVFRHCLVLNLELKQCLFCISFILLVLFGHSASAQTLSYTGQPSFFRADRGSTNVASSGYISYQFTSSSACSDVWIRLNSISGLEGKLTLATNEDGLFRVGPMTTSETKAAYFYLKTTGISTVAATLSTSAFCGRPGQVGTTTLLTTSNTISSIASTQAASPQTLISTLVCSSPQVGSVCSLKVISDQGNMGGSGVMAWAPASAADWPADTFELFSTTINVNMTDINGDKICETTADSFTLLNDLYDDNTQGTKDGLSAKLYCAEYLFRLKDSFANPSAIKTSLLMYASSGGPIKFTGNFDDPLFTLSLPPSSNNVILSKSVSPTSALLGPLTVTYTVNIQNSSGYTLYLDSVKDILPSSPAVVVYVSGSSSFAGSSIPDPSQSGQTLTWNRLFTVPNGGTTLRYQASILNTFGTYTNSVTALIGSTQIDTTVNTGDNQPATASFKLGSGTITLRKTALGGNGSFDFSSSDSNLDSVSLAVTNGNTVSSSGFTKTEGSYTVSEDSLSGWNLESISCTGDTDNGSSVNLGLRSVTIDLDINENIVCTFTNVKNGSIQIIKNTIPDDAQDFDFVTTGTGLSSFSLDDDADSSKSNSITFSNLAPGNYNISESINTIWALTGLSCTGASSSTIAYLGASAGTNVFEMGDNSVAINLGASENIICTFVSQPADFGDAPASYGNARHIIPTTPGIYLGGVAPDSEARSQNTVNGGIDGSGDDTSGTDDEDGIVISKLLTSSSTNFSIPASDITLTNTSGSSATLHAWIDFNKNGSFEASEYASATVSSGITNGHPATGLSWTGLSGLSNGTTYARFRLTTTSLSDSGGTTFDDRAVGEAANGEVEDYSLSIVSGISGTVFKDENSNDTLEGSDVGVAAISVKFYRDSNSNSLFDPATDTLIDTDVTVSGGLFSLGASTTGTYFVVLQHLDPNMPSGYLPDRTVRLVSFSGSSVAGENFPLDPVTTSLASCTVSAYLFQQSPTDVYGLNLATGSSTLLASDIGNIQVNAIGFNPLDNFIYGSNNTNSNGTIAKVDGSFNVISLGPIVGLPLTSFNTGDVSPAGKLYLYGSYGSNLLQVVDVNSSSATYLQLTTLTLSQGLSLTDLAFNPIDEMIYTVANNTKNLYRINPTTGVVTDLGNTGIAGTSTFGAQFYDADGFMYLSRNQDGNIYRVDTRNPASISATATFFASGPLSGTNDGARCMYAPVLNDYGDAPSSYKTLLNDSGAKHDISLGTSYYLGSNAPDAEIDGQPSNGANADGSDEDGVTWKGSDLNGQTVSYVDSSSLIVTTTGNAYLQAWIDWDGNGTFDNDEQIAKNFRPVAGQIKIPFSMPFDAVAGVSYARFRYSTDLNLGASGAASDGEVEDYRLTLVNAGISGTVFYDDGRGGGTANNSLQDGTELGASGIRMTASDGTNSVSTLTDGAGNYQLVIPPGFGANVTLSHTHYPATGTSVSGLFVSQCLATGIRDVHAASRILSDTNCSGSIDGLEPGYVSGTSYTNYDFGIIEAVSLKPDQNGQATSPDAVSYTHLFSPGTLGAVSLSVSGGRYSYQVFLDSDCNGIIDPAEQSDVLSTGFTVGSGWARDDDGRLAACALELRVIVPAGEVNGRLDIAGLEASLFWATSEMVTDESDVTDMTTINSGATLKVSKRVRNITEGGSFAVRTEGSPGDVLEYCISYENIGINPLNNVQMSDPLPYFTSFESDGYDTGAGDQSIQWTAASTTLLSQAQDVDVGSFDNSFVWLSVGTVAPGATGSLCYKASID